MELDGAMRQQEDASIIANNRLAGDYFRVDLAAPRIAPLVCPGQFVHLRLPDFEHCILRRPFSVCDTDAAAGTLSIVYKVVGAGTQRLSLLGTDAVCNLLGPLGVGFTVPGPGVQPVIVAGGYGCAATYLLARQSPTPSRCLLGGRSAGDILLTEEFEALGCDVRVSTDDGSVGHKGLVTELLADALDAAGAQPAVYACGPNPMLRAVSRVALERGLDAEVSLDHVMCCGVGACFACVVKLLADTPDGWEYVRTCQRGPVFKASQVYWED